MPDGTTPDLDDDNDPANDYADTEVQNGQEDVPRRVDTDEVLQRRADADEYRKRWRDSQLKSREVQIAIDEEVLVKMKQQHRLRRSFFWWAVSAISAVLVGSGWFMYQYFQLKGGAVEAEVMLGWLTTSVVETLGLGYIIANYLFDGSFSIPGRNARRATEGRRADRR